jgi:hypothetical protein
VKIASKWTGYKKILGAGDLNGDGYGDLLVQDRSNGLWRYDGTVWRNNGNGKGSFGGRTKIATGWQGYKGLF